MRWARFGNEHNTWEERKDIGAELVAEYEAGCEGVTRETDQVQEDRIPCGKGRSDISRIRNREFEINQ